MPAYNSRLDENLKNIFQRMEKRPTDEKVLQSVGRFFIRWTYFYG
jgi:hypothetical protein